MQCERCNGIMMRRSNRTVLDDSGSLAITAWHCPRCQGIMEELFVRDRRAPLRRIRYTVARVEGYTHDTNESALPVLLGLEKLKGAEHA